MQQCNALLNPETIQPTISRKIQSMHQKQHTMLQLIKKDLAHAKSMQECQDRLHCQQLVKRTLHAKRQAAARAHRYFQDYELSLKSKLQKARTQEEQVFVKAVDDGLKCQKELTRAARRDAKERKLMLEDQICMQLEAMENRFVALFITKGAG